MQPQGTAPFNTAQVDALVARINAITDCSELQEVVDEVFATIQAEMDGITTQMDRIKPILALLKAPNINTIITWVTDFINAFLKPYVEPYMIYPQQIAALMASIAQLQAALEAAAKNIKTCSVTIPSVTPPTLPELPPLGT